MSSYVFPERNNLLLLLFAIKQIKKKKRKEKEAVIVQGPWSDPLPLVPLGAAPGGTPSGERASSPLGLVGTASPGPRPRWLWPRRRRSGIWEVSAGPTAALGSRGRRGTGTEQPTGHWSKAPWWGGEWWGCRRAQRGLRHNETREKQMGKSSVPISNKKK